MRTVALTTAFLAGVLAMSAIETQTTQAQDKKDEKKEERKDPKEKASYTEKVTVRHWTGNKFNNPVTDIPAFKGELKGKTVIYTIPRSMAGWAPPKSEIIEADGTVWVVTEMRKTSVNFAFHYNYVEKKKDKKD